MKIQSLPKELLAEVLIFIADHESLHGLEPIFSSGISAEQVRTGLRELSVQLLQEVEKESAAGPQEISHEHLSPAALRLLSVLNPREEKRLFKAFGFVDR